MSTILIFIIIYLCYTINMMMNENRKIKNKVELYKSEIDILKSELDKTNKVYNKNTEATAKMKKSLEEQIENMKISANYYSQKFSFWDSEYEKKAYKIICKFIENTNGNSEFDLGIIPHVSLKEVFKPKENKNLKILSMYHIDMLLVDKRYHTPLVAIEIDGKNHNEDEKTIKRDAFKNQIFLNSEIQLIRIPNEKCNYGYIKEVLDKEIGKLPPICEKCGAKLVHRINGETKERFWGCSNYREIGCKFVKKCN